MRVEAISGYGTKGPACFLIEVEGRRLLLDLGEGPEPGVFPDLENLGRIDAVLISHSHKDHIGGLDLLPLIGNPPVYATRMTQQTGKHPALKLAHDLQIQGDTAILGLAVRTGRASHAPGGVWMRIGGEDGVLYTGDWTREGVIYPLDPMPRAKMLICDCAYGTYDLPLKNGIAALTAAAANGPVLLPMPPAGRGLDIAILLAHAGLDVALCETHIDIADRLLQSDGGEIEADARIRLQALLKTARRLTQTSEPAGVMIAASADGLGGLASLLIARFSQARSARILFTGHVAKANPLNALITQDLAEVIRCNVHPRLRDVAWQIEQVRPSTVLAAFLPSSARDAFERLFPDIRFYRGV
jgi:Cft2 family RNA processing exonuclease